MSRATSLSPARPLAGLAAVAFIAVASLLAVGAGSAHAAKPCWERVFDEWTDTGTIKGNYSARCIQEAKRRVPEDIRAYTDIIDKLDAYLQAKTAGRSLESAGDTEAPPSSENPRKQPEDRNRGNEEAPLPETLRSGTTDAGSIPLPLLVLAGLALLLMAAGGAGFAHRKLKARRIAGGS